MKRLVKIGSIPSGIKNNICDVKGVLVGHSTIDKDNIHTGITCILPHNRNLFKEKCVAGSYAFNGFGKSIGLMQVDELGTIESPILLTNTLNVGKVSDGLISYMLKENEDIGKTTSTINTIDNDKTTLLNIKKSPTHKTLKINAISAEKIMVKRTLIPCLTTLTGSSKSNL